LIADGALPAMAQPFGLDRFDSAAAPPPPFPPPHAWEGREKAYQTGMST
jgi:hypothetical protein